MTRITIATSPRLIDLIELLPVYPDWMDSALCAQVDPDLWFPDKGQPSYDAKRVCAMCPVRTECLIYALANNERHGIWGGLTTRERDHLTHHREGTDAA